MLVRNCKIRKIGKSLVATGTPETNQCTVDRCNEHFDYNEKSTLSVCMDLEK
ncbi:MAG: hypothetical protein GY714_07840 [Desulfobacterales bacterium]|nr:hypothetical protein [Desulfobacterales bacterium]